MLAPPQLCELDDTNYGCTIDQAVGDYPFPTNPATVQIEGTAANNRYLRDVLPAEMSPAAFAASALRAQAIAARTYILWHIRQGSVINNSNGFQVFVPRLYDTLQSTGKTAVDTAPQGPPGQGPPYMTQSGDSYPILSGYFADIPLATLDGGQPYLAAVPDPISSHPDVPSNGHGRGMSQGGAGRWARGNLSYNVNQDYGKWSVSWADPLKILTHYYRGIHVRSTTATTDRITPLKRWVPLKISWPTADGLPPAALCMGDKLRLQVWIQNTGTETWPSDGSIRFGYYVPPGQTYAPAPAAPGAAASAYPPQPVLPGATYTAIITYTAPSNLPNGAVTQPHFEMIQHFPNNVEMGFGSLEPARPWPALAQAIQVVNCNPRAYLPLVGSGIPAGNMAH